MPEERVKFALRISPQTQQLVKDLCPRDNCQSQNEFIEKAIIFYAGFVSSKDSSEFLSSTLTSTIHGTLNDSENRLARMLFKLSVEMSMMMNIIAAKLSLDDINLTRLRGKCVEDVKRSNGAVKLDDAVKTQRG